MVRWLLVPSALLAALLAALLTASAPAAASATGPHFASAQRPTVWVEDRTDDPAWHQATQWAVDRWNEAGPFTLRWYDGTGSCDSASADRLLFCTRPYSQLGGYQGFAYPTVDSEYHITAGRAYGCGDCGFGDSRRRVVATHEIGHLIGLDHSSDPSSVMCPSGCSEWPARGDIDTLRARHAHDDYRARWCLLGLCW